MEDAMPTIRKLSLDEVRDIQKRTKGTRKLIEEEYDALLEGYSIGDYGEVELLDGENRLTVRNRLKAAAGRKGIALDFRRTKGNYMRFRVVEPSKNGSEPVKASTRGKSAVTSAKKPGGKKKRA
jgi:hypothetical protein